MTQTANNYGEVLFELGIKKDTVEIGRAHV